MFAAGTQFAVFVPLLVWDYQKLRRANVISFLAALDVTLLLNASPWTLTNLR